MKKVRIMAAALLMALAAQAQSDYTRGLSVWFDTPTSLKGRQIWYNGSDMMQKPEWAGDTSVNPDQEWVQRFRSAVIVAFDALFG